MARPRTVSVRGDGSDDRALDRGYRAAPGRRRGELSVALRWFRFRDIVGLALFTAIWLPLTGIWAVGWMLNGEVGALLCALPFALAGVLALYMTLAFLVNSTHVTVGERTLRVRHRPLPSLHSPTVELAAMRRIFVERRVVGDGDALVHVVVADVGGVAIDLVNGIVERDVALYIAQVLDDAVGLTR